MWSFVDHSVHEWDEFDAESHDVLKFWDRQLSKNASEDSQEYKDVVEDIVSTIGDNGIVQMYVTYEEVLKDICDLHRLEMPFSDHLAEHIAETILQKLVYGECVDYPELVQVPKFSQRCHAYHDYI